MCGPGIALRGSIAGLLTVLIVLSGCGMAPDGLAGISKSEQQMVSVQDDPQLTKGDAAVAKDNYDRASSHYKKALRGAQPADDDDYYLKGEYRIAAAARSRQAFVELQRGDRKSAGQAYFKAMEQLRDDYKHHLSILDSKDSKVARDAKNKLVESGLDKVFSYVDDKIGKDVMDNFDFVRETADKMLKTPPPEIKDVDLAGSVEKDVVRIPVIPDASYLRYIGKFRSKKGMCTGSIVGPGLVLTNAHCIFQMGHHYDNKPKTKLRERPWAFIHEWLYESTQYPVTGYYTHEGHNAGWDGTVPHDWAILTLGEPNNDKTVPDGYLHSIDTAKEITSLQRNDKTIFLGGYNGDLNDGFYMSMHWGCEFDESSLADGRVLHSCKTAPGSSGSPVVLVDSSGDPHLIALNAGEFGGSRRNNEFSRFAVNPSEFEPTLTRLLNSDAPRSEPDSAPDKSSGEGESDAMMDRASELGCKLGLGDC